MYDSASGVVHREVQTRFQVIGTLDKDEADE